MYCNQCGSPNPDNSNFCSNCGAPLAKGSSAPPPLHQEAQKPPQPPQPIQQSTPQPTQVPAPPACYEMRTTSEKPALPVWFFIGLAVCGIACLYCVFALATRSVDYNCTSNEGYGDVTNYYANAKCRDGFHLLSARGWYHGVYSDMSEDEAIDRATDLAISEADDNYNILVLSIMGGAILAGILLTVLTLSLRRKKMKITRQNYPPAQ